jgi:hypothetical protein
MVTYNCSDATQTCLLVIVRQTAETGVCNGIQFLEVAASIVRHRNLSYKLDVYLPSFLQEQHWIPEHKYAHLWFVPGPRMSYNLLGGNFKLGSESGMDYQTIPEPWGIYSP